jgi:hypothetical protein
VPLAVLEIAVRCIGLNGAGEVGGIAVVEQVATWSKLIVRGIHKT